jgi:hypothetical protein
VNKLEHSDATIGDRTEKTSFGHWIGLRARLARPFWAWMGVWATLCGALASNHLRWEGQALLNLLLVLLMTELAWSSIWDLVVGADWFRPLAEGWPPSHASSLVTLPYTQPHSPGGRLARKLGRFVAWWREAFWPEAGPAVLGVLAGAILTTVLAVLMPNRLRPLYAALVALAGLGMVQRRRGHDFLAGEALLRIGLGWLAGHAVFAEVSVASLVLALSFSLAAWGNLRVAAGLPRGLWLLNAGQAVGVVVLLVAKQPVAASVIGLLLFGQVAMQPSLRFGGESAGSVFAHLVRATVSQRTWPWLMAVLLVAAWTVP